MREIFAQCPKQNHEPFYNDFLKDAIAVTLAQTVSDKTFKQNIAKAAVTAACQSCGGAELAQNLIEASQSKNAKLNEFAISQLATMVLHVEQHYFDVDSSPLVHAMCGHVLDGVPKMTKHATPVLQ